MKIITIFIAVTLYVLSGASFGKVARESTGQHSELCKQIQKFSKDLKIGNSRSVTLTISQDRESLFKKTCKPSSMDEKGKTLCEWLSANTSNEFMLPNISHVMACVTNGKTLSGRDIQVKELSGKLTIFSPFSDVKNIVIDFDYNFKDALQDAGDYFVITIRGVDYSDK